MKRDWELIRKILMQLEKTQSSKACLRSDEIPDHDSDVVAYQMKLLIQAGLIEGLRGCRHCTAYSLTWEGHEFLDTVRSKPIWDGAAVILKQKGIEMSIDAFKTAARIAIGSIFEEQH
jgi:hypothetical protein